MRHVYIVSITVPEFGTTQKFYRHLARARRDYSKWFTETRVNDMRVFSRYQPEWEMFIPAEADEWPKVKVQRKLVA